jgi:hypothetical protein
MEWGEVTGKSVSCLDTVPYALSYQRPGPGPGCTRTVRKLYVAKAPRYSTSTVHPTPLRVTFHHEPAGVATLQSKLLGFSVLLWSVGPS